VPSTCKLAALLTLGALALWPSVAAAQFRYPSYYGYRMAPPDSTLRIEVMPKEAAVYVDGYFAGVVDEFDGVFQRLHVLPGEREIAIYLDGYRTHREKLYLSPRSSRKISALLDRLPAGETTEPPPAPVDLPGVAAGPIPEGLGTRGPGPFRGRRGPGGPGARAGSLTVQVRPAGAEVLIDGERWTTSAADERLVVQVAEGRHRIEVRKDGYVPFVTDVHVWPGELTPVNVSLTPAGPIQEGRVF
jgi:hypothetical protein